MPNTKSAERRMRGTARKQAQNKSAKARLKTLEKRYLEASKKENKADAQTALREISSALDKAAKNGVMHWATANRKKSRLASRLVPAKA
jgi:small subunit ribosomal protein S20